ncbi:hypothetical protein [Actinoplanes subtropicus]|uniref:hypothetical protein n=1 Tax=Actinoplanes subtropicus TaxID=543632 RepID=UPI0014700488|nr:hypothetical protein [Actinoplanes subtropicus]
MSVSAAPWRGVFAARAATGTGRHRAARSTRPILARGERALLTERDMHTGRRLVATRDAIHYQNPGTGFWYRLGWDQVEQACWDAGRAQLRLVSRRPEEAPDVVLRTAAPDRLLRLARERIGATTLAHAPLWHDGRVVGSVSARRPASGDHDIDWVVHVQPGTVLPDGEIAGAIARLTNHIGI